MTERLRNCFHILMVPIWRRKYFLASAGLLWAVFYIYVHYVGGPNQADVVAIESGAAVSLTTGSMSAKLPVDMTFILPEESKKMFNPFRDKNPDEQKVVTKEPSISRKPIEKPSTSSRRFTNNGLNSSTTRFNNQKNAEEPSFSDRRGQEIDRNANENKFGLTNPTRAFSLKEQFMIDGVQPTSILIGPKPDNNDNSENSTKVQSSPYIPELRLVHFDLKGAPPKVSYFKSIFPLLKNAGANGIILEYEDTFPFWGSLAGIAAGNAYKLRDIKYILQMAKEHDLHVIPLLQTFGHMEFVLKLPEYKHLREVEESPQALCPTNNGSLTLVKTIIDQVLSVHLNSKYLHIGSDEVFHLGHCKRCSRYDRNSLFLAYVRKVAKHVRDVHKITPIMWDDMLRHITPPELEKYELGKLVEPMVWTYVEDVYLFIPDSLWLKYAQVFTYIWTASAFKGAFGETLTVPDAKRHLENNRAWMTVMKEQSHNFKSFRGIALTGWQRYDHFASLCELLPAGLPSLVLNLLTVSRGSFDETIFPKMQEVLDCASRKHYHLDLEHDPYLWRALSVCFFPGSSVFRLTLRHYDVSKSVEKFIYDTTVHKGWLTEYNVNHNFTSPLRVNELMREFSYYNSSLQMLLEAAVKGLREVYDDYTVSEWVELNIYPLMKGMKKVWEIGVNLKKFDVWSRRPLPKMVKIPPPNTDLGFIKS